MQDALIQAVVRSLQGTENLADLNAILNNTRLNLPDTTLDQNGLTATMTDLFCTDIVLDDLNVNYTVNEANSQLDLQLRLESFSANCYMKYATKVLFITEEGSAKITTNNNQIQMTATFATNSSTSNGTITFADSSPTVTDITLCNTVLDVTDMEFQGGLLGSIIEILKNSLDKVIETQVQNTLCDKIVQMDTFLQTKLLGKIQAFLDPFLLPTVPVNPVVMEQESSAVLAATGKSLLRLPADNRWLQRVSEQLYSILGQVDIETQELGVNTILRKFMDSEGALTMDLGTMGKGLNPVLLEGQDVLTHNNITLKKIRVYGLDSITEMTPIQFLANYSIGTSIALQHLAVELHLRVVITASSKEDALFTATDPVKYPSKTVDETITVKIGLKDLGLSAAGLFAMAKNTIGNFRIAQLLPTRNLLQCIFAGSAHLAISKLDLRVGSIDKPQLSGFVAPKIDQIIETLVESMLVMFEPTVLKALPQISQQTGRRMINTKIFPGLQQAWDVCPVQEFKTADLILDWRELLYAPKLSKELGGSGTHPYGDLGFELYFLVNERFHKLNPSTKKLEINYELDGLVFNTPDQPGVFSKNGDLIKFDYKSKDTSTSTLLKRFQFLLSNVSIHQLDNIVEPLVLLKPTQDPHVLNNQLAINPVANGQDPISLNMRMMMNLEGASTFNTTNDIRMWATLDSLSLSTGLKARINAKMLADMPLRTLINPDCWLTMLSPADDGRSLQLQNLKIILNNLDINVECVECNSKGVAILPELIEMVKRHNFVTILQDRLPQLVEQLSDSPWMRDTIDRYRTDAPYHCPSRSEYSKGTPRKSYISFPQLTKQSFDTLAFSGATAIWAGFIVLNKHLEQLEVPEADPMDAEKSFVAPLDSGDLLDWSALGKSTGLGNMVDVAFDQARSYLTQVQSDGKLRINMLVDQLLKGRDYLTLDLSNAVSFNVDTFTLKLSSLSVKGLNGFTSFDILKPIGSQTLDNSASLKSVDLSVKLSMGYMNEAEPIQDITISFSLDELSVNVALFAAFDVDRLRKLPIAQLLQLDNILPCLLSAAHDATIPRLALTLGSFHDVKIEGLVEESSASMKAVVDESMEKYGDVIVNALPKLVQTAIQEVASSYISKFVKNRGKCNKPLESTSSGFVDLRDLLLSKAKSAIFGGSGSAPYGDLIPRLISFLEDQLVKVKKSTGLSSINEILVRPLTKQQSGTPGTLAFNGNLFDRRTWIAAGGLHAVVHLKAYDAYVSNLDTISEPVSILQAVKGEPYEFNNTASIGVGSPLELGIKFLIEFAGEGVFISCNDDIASHTN